MLHLLYARFWHKVLFDLGVVTHAEPFQKLVHQGIILGEDGEKMSKSRGNVVNPDDVIAEHGADALRLYQMFMGPLEQTKPWQTSGIEGVHRFLDRVWNVLHRADSATDAAAYDEATQRLVHKTIQKVTGDIEALRFNTAISAMMILVKHLGGLARRARAKRRGRSRCSSRPSRRTWARSCGSASGHDVAGLRAVARRSTRRSCKDDVVEIGVQVNGKVRGAVDARGDADEATARAAALGRAERGGARRGARR